MARMEVNDVVLIRNLEGSSNGENWEHYNGRHGILEWRDAVDGVVVLNSGRTITLDLYHLHPTGVNVAHGRQVMVEGLTSSDWRPLNGKIGHVVGELRADGCIEVQFAPPWGTVPLRLGNLARVTEAQAVMADQHHVEETAAGENNGLAYMCKEGTLVEVHGLKSEAWDGLNGVTGVICGPITQEADTLRVPVAFADPWADLPLLVSNIRPAATAKYVTLSRNFNDPSHGMTLEGMTVVEVDYGSPSWKAGVVPGDVIRAISNVPVWNMTDMIGHIPNVCQLTLETAGRGSASGPGSAQPRYQNKFERAINGERVGHRLPPGGQASPGYNDGRVMDQLHSTLGQMDAHYSTKTLYEQQLEQRVAMLEKQVSRTAESPARVRSDARSDSPTSYALHRDRELMNKIASAAPADLASFRRPPSSSPRGPGREVSLGLAPGAHSRDPRHSQAPPIYLI